MKKPASCFLRTVPMAGIAPVHACGSAGCSRCRRRAEFLIFDEISTRLDVITQAQLWNRILTVAEQKNMGLLAATHNPARASRSTICPGSASWTYKHSRREPYDYYNL